MSACASEWTRRGPRLPRPRRRVLFGAVALAWLTTAGCASGGPIDLVAACPRTAYRAPGPPLAPAALHLRLDARPLVEHGRESYLGESHLAEQQFTVPVAESLLGALARDVRDAGVFRAASFRREGLPFRLDVDLLHAYAAVDSGFTGLFPVLPASSVDSKVEIRVVFTDEDGRVYLDERFTAQRKASAASVDGDRSAAALFGATLRDVIDQILPRLTSSYTEFWRRYPAELRR
jgi:hypothetical protein